MKISNVSGLSALKSLRALRALRPLRVVSRNESLRILVEALYQTFQVLSTLIYVAGIITWIISIILMSEFKG